MTSLTVDGITKTLGGSRVLHDLSFAVPAGRRISLVGASGSGKTTLLRLIAGFDRVDAGRILLDDQVVSSPERQVPVHRRGVGYVAQDGALFPHLTARRNIEFGLPRGTDRRRLAREAAELAGLDDRLLSRYPHELSGGQQQRVSLARAIAPSPRVVLLDEPFSALDTGLRVHTRQAVIAALEQAEMTTVLVTHDQEEALTFGHAVGMVRGGVLEQVGSPSEVFNSPVDLGVAEFLGDAVTLSGTRVGDAVTSVLGLIPISHDRTSTNAAHVSVMLRPSQLSLTTGGIAARFTIEALRTAGQYTHVTARRAADRIVFPVPTVVALPLRPGDSVDLDVNGGGVVYDA